MPALVLRLHFLAFVATALAIQLLLSIAAEPLPEGARAAFWLLGLVLFSSLCSVLKHGWSGLGSTLPELVKLTTAQAAVRTRTPLPGLPPRNRGADCTTAVQAGRGANRYTRQDGFSLVRRSDTQSRGATVSSGRLGDVP